MASHAAHCHLQHHMKMAGTARFGIDVGQPRGLSVPVMRRIAKQLGRDQELALWHTGIPDARIVAGWLSTHGAWARARWTRGPRTLSSGDLCDQVCGD